MKKIKVSEDRGSEGRGGYSRHSRDRDDDYRGGRDDYSRYSKDRDDDSAMGKDGRVRFGGFKRPRPPIDLEIDYKDPDLLMKFVTEHGRIVPSRLSRLNRKQQGELTAAIKRARTLALMPYTDMRY